MDPRKLPITCPKRTKADICVYCKKSFPTCCNYNFDIAINYVKFTRMDNNLIISDCKIFEEKNE